MAEVNGSLNLNSDEVTYTYQNETCEPPRLNSSNYRRGFQGTCGAKDFRLNTDTVNTQLRQTRQLLFRKSKQDFWIFWRMTFSLNRVRHTGSLKKAESITVR